MSGPVVIDPAALERAFAALKGTVAFAKLAAPTGGAIPMLVGAIIVLATERGQLADQLLSVAQDGLQIARDQIAGRVAEVSGKPRQEPS